MTFLEKLKAELTEAQAERAVKCACPSDFWPGSEGGEPCLRGEPTGTDFEACRACWGREAPEKTDCHANAAAMARNDEEGGGGHG